MATLSPIEILLGYCNKLKFRNLFIIVSVLFVINFFVPDFIPFIDEIILGLMAIILANIKKEKQLEDKRDIIEGEVVEDDDTQS